MRITGPITDAALLLGEITWSAEIGRLAWNYGALRQQPGGNGEPVIVLPGFATDDFSTWMLRRYLRALGYRVHGWRLGVNHGDVLKLVPEVSRLVERFAEEDGAPVRLVGWSLGGLIAREVARDDPSLIERVITMGSPTCIPPHPSTRHWFSMFGNDSDAIARKLEARAATPIEVPVTAIHALYDGIVGAADCIDSDPTVEHIDVATTHLGLGVCPAVYRIVAERLGAPRTSMDALEAGGTLSCVAA